MSITLPELIARAEITDRLHAYAQAQDQDAWDLFETVFTADAQVHLVGVPVGTLSAPAFETFLREFNRTRLSGQHLVANTLIEVARDTGGIGDTARSVSEVLHCTLQRTEEPTRFWQSEGTSLYADSWRRGADGWRIADRVVTQKHHEERLVELDEDFVATVEAGTARRWSDFPAGAGA